MQDLEVFKQIPGYKAILKAVLKNQIQSLVQQLAQQTGEESVLLTASLEEGTLTQLGSEFGKVFLEGHDEIKSQFLGFCLKRNQIQKQTKEFQESKPRKSWSSRRKQVTLPTVARRPKPYPVSIAKVTQGSTNVVSSSVDQKVLDLNQRYRKQNQAEKIESTPSYSSSFKHGHASSINGNNIHASLIPTTDEEDVKEDLTQFQDFHDSSVEFEAVTTGSPSSMHTDSTYSALIKTENQSTESTLTENIYREADFEQTSNEKTGVADRTGVEQIDEAEDIEDGYTSEKEEDYVHYPEVSYQGHGIQGQGQEVEGQDEKIQGGIHEMEGQGLFEIEGQGQSEIEDLNTENEMKSGMEIMERVGRGRPAGRKSKLRLFNQNKKASVEKSLKERKAELENYLNLENTDRPYPCSLCPKRFKERHHLVYHLRTHSGHRPYVCTICGKSFTQSSSLNTHKKLHLKDISCDFCGQVFRKISLLQNHVCKVIVSGDNV